MSSLPQMSGGVLATAATPKRKSEEFDFAKEAPMQGASSWSPSQDALAQTQLNKMLENGGQYLTAARNKGYQSAARRGLSKSSIAGSAGEEAAIGAAAPIATNDAQTYAKAQSDSANMANQMAMNQNQINGQFALTKYSGILAEESQGRDFDFKKGESALERQNRLDMQTGQQGFLAGESEKDRAARLALQTQQQGWQSSETAAERAAREKLAAQELASREALQKQQQGWQSGETAADRAAREKAQLQEQGWKSGESATDRAARAAEFERDLALRTKGMTAEQAAREREQALREQVAKDQQSNAGLDRAQRERELEAKNKQSEAQLKSEQDRMRASVASDVGRIQQTAMDARMRLEADPNMLPDAKRSAIRAIASQAKADITSMIKLSGINMPEAWPTWLNDFSPSTGSDTGRTGGSDTKNGKGDYSSDPMIRFGQKMWEDETGRSWADRNGPELDDSPPIDGVGPRRPRTPYEEFRN